MVYYSFNWGHFHLFPSSFILDRQRRFVVTLWYQLVLNVQVDSIFIFVTSILPWIESRINDILRKTLYLYIMGNGDRSRSIADRTHKHCNFLPKSGSGYGKSSCPYFRQSVCQPFFFFFCQKHNSKTVSGKNLKLHRWINLIIIKCSAQEL